MANEKQFPQGATNLAGIAYTGPYAAAHPVWQWGGSESAAPKKCGEKDFPIRCFPSEYDIHRIFPGNEIFSSARQSVLAKGVKAHEQCQGP